MLDSAPLPRTLSSASSGCLKKRAAWLAHPASTCRAGAISLLQPYSLQLRVLRSSATITVTSCGVAKQLRGLAKTLPPGGRGAFSSNRLSKPENAAGTLEMLVRFGRRSGQAKESAGELNWPIPAQGLFLVPKHWGRGEGTLPSETGCSK